MRGSEGGGGSKNPGNVKSITAERSFVKVKIFVLIILVGWLVYFKLVQTFVIILFT